MVVQKIFINITNFSLKKINSLTLAEILITIVTIGIVAILVLPSLFSNLDVKLKDTNREIFKQKLDVSLKKMKVMGDLEKKYETTKSFVNGLKKHIVIVNANNNNTITSYFGDIIYDNQGTEKYYTYSLKTSKDLGKDFESEIMVVIFAD